MKYSNKTRNQEKTKLSRELKLIDRTLVGAIILASFVSAKTMELDLSNPTSIVEYSEVQLNSILPQDLMNGLSLLLSENSFLLTTCLVIIGVIVLLFSFSLVKQYQTKHSLDMINSRKSKYQNYFSSVVTERYSELEENLGTVTDAPKEYLSKEDLFDESNRMALLMELKSMHQIIKGSEKDRLRELYYSLGFIDELKVKFSHPNWIKRIEAIQETKDFQIVQFYPELYQLTKDTNKTVRRNAIIAKISLEENPLSILHDIGYSLSTWEKHCILVALEKLPLSRIPEMNAMYDRLPQHIEFLKELAEHFHQKVNVSFQLEYA